MPSARVAPTSALLFTVSAASALADATLTNPYPLSPCAILPLYGDGTTCLPFSVFRAPLVSARTAFAAPWWSWMPSPVPRSPG